MADLLVVGNGFDLYHGLPTRYTDFLNSIKNWEYFWTNYSSAKSLDKNMQFSVTLSENKELTADTMKDFATHSGCYVQEHLDFINSHCDNSWIQYFLNKEPEGKNWIDFESEIYSVLRLVEEYYSKFIPEMRKRNDKGINWISEDMNVAVSAFKNKCPRNYNDYIHNVCNTETTQPNKLKRNKEILVETMKSELNDLIKCLGYYLLEFVSNIKVEQYSEQIKSLNGVNLLNFNYTDTYATVYGKRKLVQHHRVHGDCLEEDMVLGVPDDAFPNTLDYIYFQKYFQRIQKKTGNDYKKWITAPDPRERALDDSPIRVYIMGHSLADSDKGILKQIFENDFVEKVIIYYHSQTAYEQQVINLVSMFGKDFVIDETAKERIVFEKLADPVQGDAKANN